VNDNGIDRFLGTWQLDEWTVANPGRGNIRAPFGGDVSGYLIYSPDGWMSASLMANGRQQLTSDRRQIQAMASAAAGGRLQELEHEAGAEVLRWFLAGVGYIAYCGSFDIAGDRVRHHVRTAFAPHWVDTTLEREFEFNGDSSRLQLAARDGDAIDNLVWRRV
jgi:hypothetical protein